MFAKEEEEEEDQGLKRSGWSRGEGITRTANLGKDISVDPLLQGGSRQGQPWV